jgi:predicted PurR-regulated permease PerM
MTEQTAPVVHWLSRIPGEVFMAAIALLLTVVGAIGVAGLKFAWDINNRMTRVEVLLDSVAEHVGVNEQPRHAQR